MNFYKAKPYQNNFIISAPRSGTTWLSNMLNAHPSIFCVERRLFGNYADFIQDEGIDDVRLRVTLDKYVNCIFNHHGLTNVNKEKFTKSLIKTIQKQERLLSGKKILVDKITPYLNTSTTVLNQINTYFPKSNIVFLVRDGRDVLTSGVFHWFNKQHANKELSCFEKQRKEVYLKNNSTSLKRFFTDSEIEQWANEWAQPLRELNEAKNHKHNIAIINYEDLLENSKRILLKTLSFFKAKQNNEIINKCVKSGSFKKMSGGRKRGEANQTAHVRKGVVGDWKNYFTRKDAELFHEIAGNELIEFGYVKNKIWVEKIRSCL